MDTEVLGLICLESVQDTMSDILHGHSRPPFEFKFPSEDLMDSLISLYFEKVIAAVHLQIF